MEGCTLCGAARLPPVRFGPSLVEACGGCHALRVTPIVDPRVPSFQEHVQALREEIGVEEQEGDAGKALTCSVEEAHRHPEGARLRLQVTEGNPRWVVAGSRVEGFLDGADEDGANVEVAKKAGGSSGALEVVCDDKRWADLRRGAAVLLRPQTNATVHRNLLKAFLVVRRRFGSGDLENPAILPALSDRAVAGLNEEGLRPGQAKALRAAANLPERGILLIQGPPGTGKTTVIARILEEEARRRRTVLVTSHTHVAIDNALRKALRHRPELVRRMVRLGDAGRVAVDMAGVNKRIGAFREDQDELAARGEQATPLFRKLQQSHGIVGMTLDALACAVLAADQDNQEIDAFDTVVVDEAGMNSFPKIAIAHALGKRLILVGDPLQLPPIVRAWSFRNDENYKRSHFEVLQMLRPDLAVLLDEQFRCHPAIYAWSQHAVYAGKVGGAAKDSRPPVASVLGQPVRSPVLWVDTCTIPGNASEQAGSSRINATHTRLACDIAKDIIRQRVAPEDIGYIAPFRAQAEAFAAAATSDPKLHALARCTAATVDAFQGNERRVILFDLTTLRPAKPHEDHRRLNVSLTRAQDLLVLIGPRDFCRAPRDNPYYWSLQKWSDVQVLHPTAAAHERPPDAA